MIGLRLGSTASEGSKPCGRLAASMSIRVATLNVWALPGPIAKHKPQRMGAIVRRIIELDPHVVAFQEVWTEASREALVSGTQRAGYSHVWHNPETSRGSGLLIVSKLPIANASFEAFTARGHPEKLNHLDYYSGKGVALVTVETDAGAITILNTHLHANYARGPRPDEYKGVRAAQVIQLAASLSRVSNPLIALGDFNVEEEESSYRVLRALTGLRDVAIDLGARQPTSIRENPYHRPRHIDKRIDYVFFCEGNERGLRPLSIRREFDELLDFDGKLGSYSDHSGLVAEFAFSDATGAKPTPRDADFAVAAELIETGRRISGERRGRHRVNAASALAAGLGTLALARHMSRTRRHFLKNTLGIASGLSFAILAEHAGLSEWINPDELAAYDHAEQLLARMQAELRRN